MEKLNRFWQHDSELPDNVGNNLGWRYIATLAILLVLFFIIIRLYKRLNKKRRRRILISLSVIMPLLEIARLIWLLQIDKFEVEEDLPLQICRIMLFLEPIASITGKQKLKSFCYAVGLPGALLAYTFPPLGGYPVLSFEYLRYFTNHFLLALMPLLWVFGDKLRPQIDMRVLYSAVFLGALAMFGINSLLNSNYFYVNHLPVHVGITLNQPWYFIAIVAFMMVVVTLMILPFLIPRHNRNKVAV